MPGLALKALAARHPSPRGSDTTVTFGAESTVAVEKTQFPLGETMAKPNLGAGASLNRSSLIGTVPLAKAKLTSPQDRLGDS